MQQRLQLFYSVTLIFKAISFLCCTNWLNLKLNPNVEKQILGIWVNVTDNLTEFANYGQYVLLSVSCQHLRSKYMLWKLNESVVII